MPPAYTPSQKSAIAQFVAFTGVKESAAAKQLKTTGWNVEQAVDAKSEAQIHHEKEYARSWADMEKHLAWQQRDLGEEEETAQLLASWHPRSPLEYKGTEQIKDFNQLPDRRQRHVAPLAALFRRWMRNAEDPSHWIKVPDLSAMMCFALQRPLMPPHRHGLALLELDLYDNFCRLDRDHWDRSRRLLKGIDTDDTLHASSRFSSRLPKGMVHREQLDSTLSGSGLGDNEQASADSFYHGLNDSLAQVSVDDEIEDGQILEDALLECMSAEEKCDEETALGEIVEIVNLYRSHKIDLLEADRLVREFMRAVGLMPEMEDFQNMLDDFESTPKWIAETIFEDAVSVCGSPDTENYEEKSGTEASSLVSGNHTVNIPTSYEEASHSSVASPKRFTLNFGLQSRLKAIYFDRGSGRLSLPDAIVKFRRVLVQPAMTDCEILETLKKHDIPDIVLGDDNLLLTSALTQDMIMQSIECVSPTDQERIVDLMGGEADLPRAFEFVESVVESVGTSPYKSVDLIGEDAELPCPAKDFDGVGTSLPPQQDIDQQTPFSSSTTNSLEHAAQSDILNSSGNSSAASTRIRSSTPCPSSSASSPPSRRERPYYTPGPIQLSSSECHDPRNSSSPENGETEDLWGLKMPTNDARMLGSDLFQARTDDVVRYLGKIKSITPQRTIRKKAKSTSSKVILPRAKRKFSSPPDTPHKYPKRDEGLFAERDEDTESFIGRCVHPIDLGIPKKTCAGCGHHVCRCAQNRLNASLTASLKASMEAQRPSLEATIRVPTPRPDQLRSKFLDVVLNKVEDAKPSGRKKLDGQTQRFTGTPRPMTPHENVGRAPPPNSSKVTLPGINYILPGLHASHWNPAIPAPEPGSPIGQQHTGWPPAGFRVVEDHMPLLNSPPTEITAPRSENSNMQPKNTGWPPPGFRIVDGPTQLVNSPLTEIKAPRSEKSNIQPKNAGWPPPGFRVIEGLMPLLNSPLAETTSPQPESSNLLLKSLLAEAISSAARIQAPELENKFPEKAPISTIPEAQSEEPTRHTPLSPSSERESWRARYREVLRKMGIIIQRARRERARCPSPVRIRITPNIYEEAKRLGVNFYVFLYKRQNIRRRTNGSYHSSYFSQTQAATKSTSPVSALHKQFDKYRDDPKESPDTIAIEGTIKYLGDLGVNLDEVAVLAILTELAAPIMGELTREGFINGWKSLNCDTIAKQQSHLAQIRASLATDLTLFQKVYKHTFILARNPGQKGVLLESATEYWRLLLSKPSFEWKGDDGTLWLEWWLEFLEEKWKKSVNKDMWDQTLVFVLKSLEDGSMSWWSEDGAWPGVLDEFVGHVKAKRVEMGIEPMEVEL